MDLALALHRAGIDVAIAADDFDDVLPEAMRRPMPYRGLPTRTLRYRRFVRGANALLEREHFDIVHAMLPMPRCDVYHPHAGLAAVDVKRKPMTAVFNPRRRVFAEVERELLLGGSPPVLACLSDYVKRDVRSAYALADERMQTLFNAVDLGRFAPLPPPSHIGRLELLIVANDFARKGVATAIEAVARTAESRTHLRVVGRDDARPFERLAKRFGVESRVEFVGALADVRPALATADLFVLPTRHDPCSLVVLESLASGVPVISTRQNGACEIMTDGVHGRVLDDPQDAVALADAIRQFAPAVTRLAARDACVALRPRLSYDAHLARLMEIYDLARRSRS